ncbi:MAG: hypothetical protein IT307_18320 [Chloroflexi bacterium]|nr:hypothetical protein [Chloroflexota bacterium]
MLLPGHDLIRCGRGQLPVPIGPGERADQLGPRAWTPAPRVVREHGPPGRDILGRPHDVPRRPSFLELPDLEAGVGHQRVLVGHRLHGGPHQRPLVGHGARVGGVRPDQGQG